jgi:DNA polymerase-1
LVKAGIKRRIIDLLKNGEEEAMFSKMLATIRTDAPIYFVLPEREWRDGVDMKKVQDVFSVFEFRTLGMKFAEALSLDIPQKEEVQGSTEEIREAGLLLWVIDSNKTNPSADDVLSFTNTDNIHKAKQSLDKIIREQDLEYVFEEIEKPLVPIVDEMKKLGVDRSIHRKNMSGRDLQAEFKLEG